STPSSGSGLVQAARPARHAPVWVRLEHAAACRRLSRAEDFAMSSRVRPLKGLALPTVIAALLAAPGCVDIVGADLNRYVERDEKHFAVTAKPDIALTTFDGSIEVRPWDKADVLVVVEKRGRDKNDVAAIEVKAEQRGDRIEVTVSEPKRDHGGFNFHFHNR